MKKFKIGLIGLGLVAEAHLEGYRQVERIDVVAGAELNRERLNHMTNKWKITGYTDFEAMLAKENLDIVCVLTPAAAHRVVTEKAAAKGVHILCEKPIAVTLEDAQAIVSACDSSDVKLCYGSCYRYLCACMKAKEMIDAGELGDITLMMEAFIGGSGKHNYRDLGPHHYPAGGPGGGGLGLVDHGIHLVDIFRWFSGSEVEYVLGRGNYSGKEPHTEFLTMIFKNGAVGQLIYNEATYPAEMPGEGVFSWGGSWNIDGTIKPGGGWDAHPGSIRVHGTKGALRIYHYPNKLFYAGEKGLEQVPVDVRGMPGNFAMQMEAFIDRLFHGEEPEVTGSDGIKALQIVLAAYESFETKKMIRIS